MIGSCFDDVVCCVDEFMLRIVAFEHKMGAITSNQRNVMRIER